MNPWHVVLALLTGLALLWLALVVSLYLVGRRQAEPTRSRRPAPHPRRGSTVAPPGSRPHPAARRTDPADLLLVYLALPIDLVPDFIPVVGYADDAVVVAIALRSVARSAGVEAIDRHWPGTPEGLQAVKQLAGLP